MNFVARPVDTCGMSLALHVDIPLHHVKMDRVLSTFAAGRMESWGDTDEGYSAADIGFVCEETGETFYVYDRWGIVRIGARNPDNAGVRELASFLVNNV
jgi:hypothetical protein